MAIERLFVKEGTKESDLEEYLSKKFDRAGYSRTEIQRTPMGIRIIVHAQKPGLIIGRSGRRINELTEDIKTRFGMENPLVDVKEVDNPFLDAKIMAFRIAKAFERGVNYKKVANYYIDEIMRAGATGVMIRVAGKLMGAERSRFAKFSAGFIAQSGDYSEKLVDKGYAQAMMKPGMVGVQVKIMKQPIKEFEMRAQQEREVMVEKGPEPEPAQTEEKKAE